MHSLDNSYNGDVKPGLHISRKDCEHLFANTFFYVCLGPICNDCRYLYFQELFAIDMLTVSTLLGLEGITPSCRNEKFFS